MATASFAMSLHDNQLTLIEAVTRLFRKADCKFHEGRDWMDT